MSELKQQLYSDCCYPLHKGVKPAETAEQLMRSRYSAFVLKRSDFIVQTTLPAQQHLLDKKEIIDWAAKTRWAGLEVLQYLPKVGKRHAQVDFKAYYHEGSHNDETNNKLDLSREILAHHELSVFVKAKPSAADQKWYWYYLDPTVRMRLTQKQPCICGSGDKFKRCCGAFI